MTIATDLLPNSPKVSTRKKTSHRKSTSEKAKLKQIEPTVVSSLMQTLHAARGVKKLVNGSGDALVKTLNQNLQAFTKGSDDLDLSDKKDKQKFTGVSIKLLKASNGTRSFIQKQSSSDLESGPAATVLDELKLFQNDICRKFSTRDLIVYYDRLVKSFVPEQVEENESQPSELENKLKAHTKPALLNKSKTAIFLFQVISKRLEAEVLQRERELAQGEESELENLEMNLRIKNIELNKFLETSIFLSQYMFDAQFLDLIQADQADSVVTSKEATTAHSKVAITPNETLSLRFIDFSRKFLVQFRNFAMRQLELDRPIGRNNIEKFAEFFDHSRQTKREQIGLSVFRHSERREGAFSLFVDTFTDRILQQSSQLLSVIKALSHNTKLMDAFNDYSLKSGMDSYGNLFDDIKSLYKNEKSEFFKNKLLAIAESLSKLTNINFQFVNNEFKVSQQKTANQLSLEELREEADSLACLFIDYFNKYSVDRAPKYKIDEPAIWAAFDFDDFIQNSGWKEIASNKQLEQAAALSKVPVSSPLSKNQSLKGGNSQRLSAATPRLQLLRGEIENN